MALIKYGDEETPLNNEHSGFTFQAGRTGNVMFPAGRNNRTRYPIQWNRQQFNQRPTREWRNQSAGTVSNWESFATTYPQPTLKDPAVFLTAYQLFVKRNFWQLLNYGLLSNMIESPGLVEIIADPFTYSFRNSAEKLFLDYEFSNWDADNIVQCFLSFNGSPGNPYQNTQSRYMNYFTNTPTKTVDYGRLYNQYAYRYANGFAPTGWHVPLLSEIETLRDYVSVFGGGLLKETGLTYWSSPNSGATNSTGLTMRGSGVRIPSGGYGLLGRDGRITAYDLSYGRPQGFRCFYNSTEFSLFVTDAPNWGMPIRLLKNDSVFVPTVTGNDGQIYDCVNINGQIWTVQDSIETLLADGTPITEMPTDAEWSTTTDPGYCNYDNDPANSYTPYTGPMSLDITTPYTNRFGIIPATGEFCRAKFLPMGIGNGQFFANIKSLEEIL